jgi:diaminopimelate epimerase
MPAHFYKYQGTGNDFILIDDRRGDFDAHNHALIAHLCHRRLGIGADGLMLLRYHETVDFQMVYFNADGRPGSMCGNGGRCMVAFAQELGLLHRPNTVFMAPDGLHEAIWHPGWIELKMKNVSHIEAQPDFYFLDTGSPHHVRFVPEADQVDVLAQGRAIRYSPTYPQGTNVNFVQPQPDGSLYVRTYERGVEDETFSCGTGVTASAIAHALAQGWPTEQPHQVQLTTRGGQLEVAFVQTGNVFAQVWLKGPAQKVFEGQF